MMVPTFCSPSSTRFTSTRSRRGRTLSREDDEDEEEEEEEEGGAFGAPPLDAFFDDPCAGATLTGPR
jgi:hypothetical protein